MGKFEGGGGNSVILIFGSRESEPRWFRSILRSLYSFIINWIKNNIIFLLKQVKQFLRFQFCRFQLYLSHRSNFSQRIFTFKSGVVFWKLCFDERWYHDDSVSFIYVSTTWYFMNDLTRYDFYEKFCSDFKALVIN